ncbi:FtsX-like permease family protein [Pseudoflavitalea sp. X16]|uniref:ABC transporter permease n=1 Tax=Paraflavitalea devenefica TaxID=2716334 RepID=UPI00141DBE8B|nr:ABC transporter permease [Paraflavitalea devenefica]NII28868.1 FtsX-like permease family protein [Paraflavitalea devenefica]
MIKSFFRIAWRNMMRSKGFSSINIAGLVVGMASAILILLWIQNEVSYDQFHEKKDRIYEAWNRAEFSGELNCWNTTPKVLARTLEKDLPEVEMAARVDWGSNFLFTVGDKKLTVRGTMVDSNFLQIFSFPLLKGNPTVVLKDMHSIVLTEKLAKKLFGKEDAMGKIIKIDNKENFTVTGILEDLPNNTRFRFEYLVPWAYKRFTGDDDENWGNNSTRTYVLLKPNATLASAAPKVKVMKQRYAKDEPKWEMFLYPMSKWRLYSSFTNGKEDGGGRITFVRLFGIVAAFILLIACINFMNLSTARSEKRAKEVGIRKVVGAQKISLIGQFIGESLLLSLIAGFFAIIVVQLSLGGFNKLTDKELYVPYGSPWFWLVGLGFVLFTGLLAGSYPAFFLSSFKPVKVLKGTFKKTQALVAPRKVLVVLQFTFAIILIICTIIVKQQIDYAQNRHTGYNKNSLIYHVFTGDIEKNFELIRNELLSTGAASSVTKTSAPITQSWSDGWGQEWEGKDPNDKTDFYRYNADQDLGKTAGLQFVQGRDFDLRKFPTDSTGMIINESSLKVMKFKNPIGKIVKDNGQEWHIVGVIKDFILTDPYQPTRPMLIAGGKAWFFTILIRLNSNNTTEKNLKTAESIFRKYNVEYPFEYKFVDEEYAQKFEDEQRIGTLAGLFAGLTIFISCLGLFGLAIYMAESRVKEIGVRKVLGASVSGLAALLSKDFLMLVLISFLLAVPVAWWAMHAWLSDYPYRITIQWWVFALAGLLSVLIALATVSYQAIRAALANPVKSLRTE